MDSDSDAKEPHEIAKDELTNMVGNTSCLAFGNIFVRKHIMLKLMWGVVFSFCTLFAVGQIIELTQNYLSYPLRSVVKIQSKPVDFPRITFCNLNPVRFSKIDYARKELRDFLLEMKNRKFTPDNDNEIVSRLKDERRFTELYFKEDRETRLKMGHRLSDFILQCSFMGKPCNKTRLFTEISVLKYGNCFMFDPKKFEIYEKDKFQKRARSKGLFITFYLQNVEYLPNFISSIGIRTHFHIQDSVEIPQFGGLILPPGFEISIAIKPEIIRKSNFVKDNCETGKEFKKKYNLEYTKNSCNFVCLQKLIFENCRCYNSFSDEIYKFTKSRYCKSDDEIKCMLKVIDDYQNDNEVCKCVDRCNITHYSIQQSFSQWPAETYETRFFNDLKDCYANFRNASAASLSKARENLTNLLIYVKDDFYNEISEVTSYSLPNYLSDIGGTLSLYLGFSILTGFECIEGISLFLTYLWGKHRSSSPTNDEKKQLVE